MFHRKSCRRLSSRRRTGYVKFYSIIFRRLKHHTGRFRFLIQLFKWHEQSYFKIVAHSFYHGFNSWVRPSGSSRLTRLTIKTPQQSNVNFVYCSRTDQSAVGSLCLNYARMRELILFASSPLKSLLTSKYSNLPIRRIIFSRILRG